MKKATSAAVIIGEKVTGESIDAINDMKADMDFLRRQFAGTNIGVKFEDIMDYLASAARSLDELYGLFSDTIKANK